MAVFIGFQRERVILMGNDTAAPRWFMHFCGGDGVTLSLECIFGILIRLYHQIVWLPDQFSDSIRTHNDYTF